MVFVFNDGEQSAVLDKHFRRATITGPDPVSGELSTETFTPPFIDRMPLLLDAIRNDTETYTPARTGILATWLWRILSSQFTAGGRRRSNCQTY